ncbi:hypothetical protein BH18ACT11_BH18ACT11_07300 [soil metagenome]
MANTLGNPVSSDKKLEPSNGRETSEVQENPEVSAPEMETKQESGERIRELLMAYQQTLDAVAELPAVVWVTWGQKRPGSYFKVPYLRSFLKYFVVHHINRSLSTLNRRFYAIAALSGDPDANRANRETVKLYLQSLPGPPYRLLIFAVVLAALVVALPLQGFGNVFYVLDLVGAMLRSDVSYVGRAFAGKELGPTVRALIVTLFGLIVVAALLTSPFGLKRILFNLHPLSRERLDSTAARGHGFRAEGLYALEDRIFEDVGIGRPREGRWDLVFQTFLLSLLLVFEVCLAGLTLAILMSWNINLNVDTGASAKVTFMLPELWWGYYPLFNVLVLAVFVLLLKRVVSAWSKRGRKAIG